MKSILTTLAAYNAGQSTSTLEQFQGVNNDGKELPELIISIINVIIGVLGIVAVLVIILGGIQYMTSQGDPGKVKKAKDTILYGVIGLIICILAFAIVNFIIASLVK